MSLRGGPVGSSLSAVSVPGWRPEDFHRFLTNFLDEGVVQGVGSGLAVSQRGAGANMSVDVAAGLALIEITTTLLSPDYTFKTWLYNDGVINIPVPTADPTNPRKDRIVAVFDMTIDPNGSASDIVSIELIEGTPAGSPSAPATPSNAISLAVIDVPASDTAIGNAQITDDRAFVEVQSDVLLGLQRAATAITTTRAQFATFTELTIASGAITVTQTLHTVDTQADASTDDLDTITAAYGAGEIIHLKADNTGRTIVVKHNTGNIKLADALDFSIDDTEKSITLVRKGSEWHELARGRGPAAAEQSVALVYANTAASTGVGASSTAEHNIDTNYTIPAGGFVAGSSYAVDFNLKLYCAGASGVTVRLKLGSTVMVIAGTGQDVDGHVAGRVMLQCLTDGAGGTVIGGGTWNSAAANTNQVWRDPTTSDEPAAKTIDTTATNVLQFSVQFADNNGSNLAQMLSMEVTRLKVQ